MIKRKVFALALVSSLALAACSKSAPEQATETTAAAEDQSASAAGGTIYLHDDMLAVVIPQTQVIWDVSNATYNDDGEPDAKLMKDADWAKVKAASTALIATLDSWTKADKVVVVKPGEKIMDQDLDSGAKPEEVQARIDANMNGFHDHAKQMKEFFTVIDKAADTKNFQTFYDKSNEADGACEGCHKAFWLKPTT